jgi:uncharacterized protein
MHYLLFYEKAPDYAQREPAHQAAHRAHVFAAVDRGELVLGGPLTDAADGANVLLFQSDAAATAEVFAKADPYVQHGIVTYWRVRPWQTVVGPGAACPLPGSESDRH